MKHEKAELVNELAELLRTKPLFKGLFEFAPDAVVVVDKEGSIVQINKQAENIFGYSREEVIGKPVELFVPERFREMHVEQRKHYMRKPSVRFLGTELELFGRKKDGTEFPADILLSPLDTDKGTVVLGIVRDITEHKRTDEELRLLLTLTQAINEAKDLNAAMQIALEKVCEATGWNYAEAWVQGKDKKLVCSNVWYISDGSLEKFRKFSEGFTFSLGEGIPGRVWLSRQPEWIPDVSLMKATIFPRVTAVKEAGLKAGLGVPIIADGKVLAVLVFFMFEPRKKDERLVSIVSAVATELGSVIQRKQMEEALRESEIKYRSIFENAVEGIFQTSVEGRILAANPACARLFGSKTPEELIAQVTDVRKIYVEPGRRLQLLRTIKTYGIITDFEAQVFKKDGSKIWILINAHAMRDSNGNVVGLEGMVMDITSRKRAEKNFERLMECLPDAVMAIDSSFSILLVNANTEKMFGYTRKELLGKNYDMLIPERFREKHVKHCEGYFAEPVAKTMALHLEAFAMRKDESEFPVEINMSPIETEEGVIVLIDIRERK